MFISDRDLLLLEPNLFRDASWAGQLLVSGTGDVSGTTLTLSTYDVDFDGARVDAGYVVLVDGTPYEVIAKLTATTATISRLREDTGDSALTPSPVTSKPVSVMTFRPQASIAHAQVLRMLGIEPADSGESGAIIDSDITNPGDLVLVESFAALHMIFAAVSSLSSPTSPLVERMEMYRQRFATERQRAAALIDTNGDGIADATRRLNVVHLTRS